MAIARKGTETGLQSGACAYAKNPSPDRSDEGFGFYRTLSCFYRGQPLAWISFVGAGITPATFGRSAPLGMNQISTLRNCA